MMKFQYRMASVYIIMHLSYPRCCGLSCVCVLSDCIMTITFPARLPHHDSSVFRHYDIDGNWVLHDQQAYTYSKHAKNKSYMHLVLTNLYLKYTIFSHYNTSNQDSFRCSKRSPIFHYQPCSTERPIYIQYDYFKLVYIPQHAMLFGNVKSTFLTQGL